MRQFNYPADLSIIDLNTGDPQTITFTEFVRLVMNNKGAHRSMGDSQSYKNLLDALTGKTEGQAVQWPEADWTFFKAETENCCFGINVAYAYSSYKTLVEGASPV